jgi:hypothetical protein
VSWTPTDLLHLAHSKWVKLNRYFWVFFHRYLQKITAESIKKNAIQTILLHPDTSEQVSAPVDLFQKFQKKITDSKRS